MLKVEMSCQGNSGSLGGVDRSLYFHVTLVKEHNRGKDKLISRRSQRLN